MINIFDLSAGMGGTKHRDGSPVRKSRSDVIKKPIDPVGVHRDDITINTNSKKSSSKSGGTPMKMLIAQELLKETEPRQKQTSIVARLMGLDDALPVQHPVLASKTNFQEEYPRSKSAGSLRGRRQHEEVNFDGSRSREIHSCSHEKEYKDVYEVWQQSRGTNNARDHAPLKERVNRNQNEKKMALVRQTFREAKRLVTDEKHMHSKEFQDAVEVLSSNKDAFLQFLEEPNSLFLKNMKLQTLPSTTKTKRIAILKPSANLESKGEKHVRQKHYPSSGGNGVNIEKCQRVPDFSRPKTESLYQSTRIVVLKPSPTKIRDLKATVTTPIFSPNLPQQGGRFGSFETGQVVGSREIAKETAQEMQESVASNWRDELMLSSTMSNGYVGDTSSFDKSDNECTVEGVCTLSDTEIMTPTSRSSWDFNNRIGSPRSVSSFSRASGSPESSMVREAKKRLSERWAFVVSNSTGQEEMQVASGSSTLGEMLAGELKKELRNGLVAVSSNISGGDDDLRTLPARLSVDNSKAVDGEESSSSLPRSKSVPVTSSAYKNIGLKEVPNSQIDIPIAHKEAAKPKSGKSSFKGKVSSFFSRKKKHNKEKTVPSPLLSSDDRIHSETLETVSKNSDDLSRLVRTDTDEIHFNCSRLSDSVHNSGHKKCLLIDSQEQFINTSTASGDDDPSKDILTPKVALSLEKPRACEILSKNQGKLGASESTSGNQDQPSPISVLDAPFEDDVQSNISPSSEIMNVEIPQALSRSEPIESVVRTLSWDDVHMETSSSTHLKLWRGDEEKERFTLVQDLLSSAGLDQERVNSVFNRWHSLESPLDPAFLFNILDQEEGAKGRERRSNQRLLFDSVNNALLDIGQALHLNSCPWSKAFGISRRDSPTSSLVAKEVWGLVSVSFFSEGNWDSPDTDNDTQLIDGLLRKDVAGTGWSELNWMELDEVCQDITVNISEELIGEALLDFTDECV